MSWIKPAVCPLKGNTSWVVRPRIAESTSSRSCSASLRASWVRPNHALTKGVGSTRGTVAYAPPPAGGKIPSQAGIEPHYVLGLGLEYRPLPSLLGRGFLRGKEARAHVGSLGA